MKITGLTTFIVPPRWCFLKIETDEGIHGWGEPVLEGRAHSVAAAVEELADYLIGKDPRIPGESDRIATDPGQGFGPRQRDVAGLRLGPDAGGVVVG